MKWRRCLTCQKRFPQPLHGRTVELFSLLILLHGNWAHPKRLHFKGWKAKLTTSNSLKPLHFSLPAVTRVLPYLSYIAQSVTRRSSSNCHLLGSFIIIYFPLYKDTGRINSGIKRALSSYSIISHQLISVFQKGSKHCSYSFIGGRCRLATKMSLFP